MPELTPYVTAAMLRAALTIPTYLALFDEEQIGVVPIVDASDGVQLVLKRGHARVVSRLPAIYVTLPTAAVTTNIPTLLQDAELCYCEGLAYNRHAEYARTYGAPKFAEADEIMDALQAAVLRIADNPPEAKPRNVGGILLSSSQRVMLNNVDGTRNSGDF